VHGHLAEPELGQPAQGVGVTLGSLLAQGANLGRDVAFAVSFGAPFWFEALSKLGSLRNTGTKPATTA